MPAATVERKILFYRICPRRYADGRVPQISVETIFAEVKKLVFDKSSSGPKSRYCDIDDKLLCAWPSTAGNKLRLELGRVRRIDLPSIDDGGQVKPLPIEDDEGLLEISHMQFFPNNIVGAEFNYHAPRASAFGHYVDEKLPSLPKFTLRPLLRNDALEQLNELSDIRLLDIRVHKADAEILGALNESLPAALSATTEELNGESFEILFRPKRKKPLSERAFGFLSSMIKGGTPLVEQFETLKVRGESSESGKVVGFNLLRDQFIKAKHIAKIHGKTRAVDESKMYAAIEEAYNTLRDQLEVASSVEEVE